MIKLPRGTRDYDGEDYERLQVITKLAVNTFETFQGEPIITPMFERRDVLTNKYGEEEKLIFNLEKGNEDNDENDENDDNNIEVNSKNPISEMEKEYTSLRYDMTVPFVRYVLSNNIVRMKRYTIGKVFRRETTNKKIKRLREFHQADFDFVGLYDMNLPEIQIFKMINVFFSGLGVTNYTIKYNFRDLLYYYVTKMAKVSEDLFKQVCISLDKLDKKSIEYVKDEMSTRGLTSVQVNIIFDCIAEAKFPLGENVDTVNSNLLEMIVDYGITNIQFDPTLARGLDYYTGIIFEVTIDGFGSSVGGGGRYDKLINQYNSEVDIQMIGFSLGLDRLLQYVNITKQEKPTIIVFTIIQKTTDVERKQLNKVKAKVIDDVISKKYVVDFMFNDKKARKQFSKFAADPNYKYAIIIGMDEVSRDSVAIKNLTTKEQTLVKISDIKNFI
jgi:histidyl-tRNA synthetase